MPYIGTHNGKFHCDEVFACYLLKKLPEFKNHAILRSRDPEVLGTCELIVDVGRIYDHEKKRYDHHQRDFKETMKSLGVLDEFETKLSSAGLIYAHYGRKVIAAIVELPEDHPTVALLYRKLYEGFVESVDAIDNGIPQFDGVPRYHLASTLGGRVNSLNPDWNEKDVNQDERFTRAMKIVGEEFEDRLRYLNKAWLPAKEMVEKAVEDRRKVHPSGKIIALEQGGVPWKEHFFTIEKERQLEAEDITYIIYADDGGDWRVQAIPVDDLQAFENRCPLPEPWRGVRDDKLAEVSDIKDAKFCHVSGFIGGAKTRDGALQMAVKSLEIHSKL